MRKLLNFKLGLIFLLFFAAGNVKGQKQYRVIVEISDASSIYPSGTPNHYNTTICKSSGCYITYQKPYFNGQNIVYQTVTEYVGYNKGNFNEWVLEEKDFPLKIISDGIYADCYNIGTSSQYCFERCNQKINDIYPISYFVQGLGYSSSACLGTTKIYSTFLSDISTIGVCENLIIENTDVSKYEYSLDGINNWTNIDTYSRGSNLNIIPSTLGNVGNNYSGNLYIRGKFISGSNQIFYTDILTVSINPCAPKVTTTTLQNTTCSDNSDGSATFTFDRDLATGEYFDFTMYKKDPAGDILVGTNQYIHPSEFINKQFTWDNLGAGTYYLRYQTKLDGGAAIATAENSLDFTITSPTAVSFGTSQQNVKCKNGNSGSISVTAQGGSGSYEYSKDGGATWQNSATFSGLVAGSYSVLVKDSKGCVAIQGAIDIAITEPYEALDIAIVETNDPIEHDGNQGNIEVSASGGTGNLSFAWQNSFGSRIGSGAIISNLVGGSYTVTVTDTNVCSASRMISLTNPPIFSVSISSLKGVSCHGGSDAQLKAVVSGGAAPLSYDWEGFSYEDHLNTIPAGTYKVTITDFNNVVRTSSFTVSEPSALQANLNLVTAVSCHGGNNGGIDINVSGGTSPYSYQWKKNYQSFANTQDVSSLSVGVYDVTITDAKGCITELTDIEITEPEDGIALALNPTSPLSFGATNGSINLDVSGGTSPYTYLWNTGSTAQNLQNIGAGYYSVTVTDSKLCTASDNWTLTQPEKLEVSLSQTASILCKSESTASLQSTVAGGVSPYSYQWKKDGQALSETAETLEEIAAGIYTLTVTDANNIQIEASFTISEPTALAAQSTVTEVLCFGNNTGAIDLSLSGGTAPYTYQWVKEGSTTVIATTQDLSNLLAGNYTVTAIDINGCSIQLENSTVVQPLAPLTLASDIETPTSFGGNNGNIFLSVTGGTAPYSYLWNNGSTTQDLQNLKAGTYSVEVTDSHGCTKNLSVIMDEPNELIAHITQEEFILCQGDATALLQTSVSGGVKPYSYQWKKNGQWLSDITSSLADLVASDYELILKDKFNTTVNIAYTILEPTALSTSYQVTDVLCFGNATGAIDFTISGGTPPYSYLWSNGSTTQDVSNLKAGTYDVLCTDANGCTKEMTNIIISQPSAPLTLSSKVTQPTGFGLGNGSISVTAQGGTTPYTYEWNTGQTSPEIASIKAGDYTVTIIDANACKTSLLVTLTQPELLKTTISVSNPLLCFADANGSLKATTQGGVPPYTYSWKKGSSSVATSDEIKNVTADSYTVTVTDTNNNQVSQNFVLGQPDLLTVGFDMTPISCSGDKIGSLTALPQGGVMPYSYSWSNGASTAKISNMGTGNYLVNVTDANGCATLAKGTITSTSAIKVNSKVQDPSCYAACNGSITLEITGGSGDYSMEWDTVAKGNGLQATNLCAGNYSVSVQDNVNGCILPMDFTLNQPSQLTVNLGDDRVLCAGQSTLMQPVINKKEVTYNWTSANGFSASTAQVNLDKEGEYQLEVTNANGCKATDSVRITASDQLLDATFLVSSQTYTNQDIVLINVSNQSGQTYEWLLPAEATVVSEISKSKIIKFSKIGVYTVALKAKNEAGCTTTSTKQLLVEEDPKLPDPNPQVSSFIKEFLVYPNPTINNGLFTVKVSLSESAPISLTLYEQSNGGLLNQTDLPASKEHLKEYSISLSSGIYLIILRTSKGVQSKKIIVN